MEDLDDLWLRLSVAKNSLLIFDYEGTLTGPSVGTSVPEPLPWVTERIESILTGGSKVGIIANHSVDEVTEVLRFAWEVDLWGLHGSELRKQEETILQFVLSTEIKAGFKHAIDRIKIAGWQSHLIRKHGVLIISWIGLPRLEASKMQESVPKLLKPVLRNEEFVLVEHTNKYELTIRNLDKSSAVASMILDSDRDAVIAYFGDDESDIDAFRMLNGTGDSFLVNPKKLRTPADHHLTSSDELSIFLEKWNSVIHGIF